MNSLSPRFDLQASEELDSLSTSLEEEDFSPKQTLALHMEEFLEK